jgi:hypothetical protein
VCSSDLSYTIVVTNSNGCSATSAVTTVTVNPNPTASITAGGATTFCQGGSVVLNANTGTDLSYQWLNNGTNISGATSASYTANTAGSYTVVVNNSNGCSATSTFTSIIVNGLPTVNAGQDVNVCAGTPVTLNGTGASTYSWNNNVQNGVSFVPLATTTYTVIGSDAVTGCENTDEVLVTVNALPIVTLNLTSPICDTLQTFTLTGGLPLGGAYAGPSVASNSFNPAIGPGQYTIQYSYTDVFGCSNAAAQTITVIGCNTAAIFENNKNEIIIYPNPTSSYVTIETPEYLVGKKIYVYDLNGKIIMETMLLNTVQTINMENVVIGSYYLKIEDEATLFKLIKR